MMAYLLSNTVHKITEIRRLLLKISQKVRWYTSFITQCKFKSTSSLLQKKYCMRGVLDLFIDLGFGNLGHI